jgi:hypothetical protein
MWPSVKESKRSSPLPFITIWNSFYELLLTWLCSIIYAYRCIIIDCSGSKSGCVQLSVILWHYIIRWNCIRSPDSLKVTVNYPHRPLNWTHLTIENLIFLYRLSWKFFCLSEPESPILNSRVEKFTFNSPSASV